MLLRFVEHFLLTSTQEMACWLFSVKALYEPMLRNCQLGHKERVAVKHLSQF